MTAIAAPLTAEPLWTRVRAMFARAVADIGAPAAIAANALLGKTLRRELIAWLCPLEHVVRKLLLTEAAALHRAETERARRRVRIEHIPLRGMALHGRPQVRSASLQARTGSRGAEKCEPDGSRSNFDRAAPVTWRARFSFALPRASGLPNARAPRIRALWGPTPPAPPLRAPRIIRADHAPFRLARRFEALRRVLENPRPHVARLARLLAREARRVLHLVRRYLLAPCRSNDYDLADPRLSLDAMGAAWDAPEAFVDSS